MRSKAAALARDVQKEICQALEALDGKERFQSDSWERTDSGGGYGGGGLSRVLSGGAVFEKAGVNFSEVEGMLPIEMSKKLIGKAEEAPFFATGVSLVIHPLSPIIPTTHANFRYLEVGEKSWFGGGMDLTPYYLFDEDALHYHQTIKSVCERHDETYYPRFKKWCDEYFYLPHRGEARGVGGIFYDYLGKEAGEDPEQLFPFHQDIAHAFVDCYAPIVERRKAAEWTDEQKKFQLLRRGRYVEFNLLFDRGTQFGLHTGGRTESILMSLPPVVHWDYGYQPAAGSEEARLVEVLSNPREWA